MPQPKRRAGRPTTREPDMKTWKGRLAYRLHQAAIAKEFDEKKIADLLANKYHIRVDKRTVEAWFVGARTPELEKLRALADLLEFSMDEIWK